jgi:hypothetical protein
MADIRIREPLDRNGKTEIIHILIQVVLWFLAGGTLFVQQGRHADRLERLEEQRQQMMVDVAVLQEKIRRLEEK